jgi:hypothetical protein
LGLELESIGTPLSNPNSFSEVLSRLPLRPYQVLTFVIGMIVLAVATPKATDWASLWPANWRASALRKNKKMGKQKYVQPQ